MRRFNSKVVYQKYVLKKLWKRLLVKNKKITVNCASTKNRVDIYERFKKKIQSALHTSCNQKFIMSYSITD